MLAFGSYQPACRPAFLLFPPLMLSTLELIQLGIPIFVALFLSISGFAFNQPDLYIPINGRLLDSGQQVHLQRLSFALISLALLLCIGYSIQLYPIYNSLEALKLYLMGSCWVC